MTFSNEWENIYRSSEQMSIWPWSDLVAYVMRYARPTGPEFRVLEIGVGAGANVPFFHHLKTQYYGVDGSTTAVDRLKERFPAAAANFVVADFTRELPVPGQFDLVVDRGALTANTGSAVKACLRLVHEKLKPGGKLLSIDFYSDRHSDSALGRTNEDKFTKTEIPEGHLAGTGNVHFADEAQIKSLFSDFEIIILEHKTIERLVPANSHVFASFNVACRKGG